MIVKFRGIYMFENLLSFTAASLVLENKIMSNIADKYFGDGVDEFAIVTIVENPLMPMRNKDDFIKGYHKVSRYKQAITKESVKYISVVLFFDREDIEGLTKESMCAVLAKALILRLENINLKIPKKFNYEKFHQYILEELKSFEVSNVT